ncbi:MAG: DUF934 domain-containing protein [Pseudomonadota bacterium]
MPRLHDASGVIDDGWTYADAPLPNQPTIVPLAALKSGGPDFDGVAPARLGVAIPNDVRTDAVAPVLPQVSLVAVDFPSFADGRGFSIARRLRAAGFDGVLRATGPVISDQFAMLLACGFDTIEIPDEIEVRQDPADWSADLERFSARYQRGYGGRASILEARRAARGG